MYRQGKTPSAAIREFMGKLHGRCKDQLQFHYEKADQSKCPRRRDFYNIYMQYCKELFGGGGGGNGEEMMAALDELIEVLRATDPELAIFKQNYDSEGDQPFILAVVTSLKKRVHQMVNIYSYHIKIN